MTLIQVFPALVSDYSDLCHTLLGVSCLNEPPDQSDDSEMNLNQSKPGCSSMTIDTGIPGIYRD